MYLFFVFTLLLSFLIGLLLFLILLKRLEVNWQRRNKHAASYILPVLFTILFVLHVGFDLQGRVLDFIDILQQNPRVMTASADEMTLNGNRLKIDGESYIVSPDSVEIAPETYYRINYTERSHVVLSFEELTELPETPDTP